MSVTVTAICVAALFLLFAIWIKRARDQNEIERHSITPEALHTLLASIKRFSFLMFASRSTC
jgi:hypothetical protein